MKECQKEAPMQQVYTTTYWRLGWRLACLLLLLGLPWMGTSCTGTTLPFLQHLKRPLAMAAALQAPDGESYLFIANADLDRVAMVRVNRRELYIDPDPSTPGILLIPTGRYPVSLAVTPDQKKMYVLNGIEGNIGVIDLSNFEQTNEGSAPLRLPKGCTGNCFQSPTQLLLHSEGQQLLGFVTVPSESAIVVLDLTDGAATYGTEIKRFRVQGFPNSMFKAEGGSTIYVTNSRLQTTTIGPNQLRQQSFVHAIDTTKLTLKNIKVCETGTDNGQLIAPPCGASTQGSASSDGQWMYLIDQVTGGVRVYDLKNNTPVKQGDGRFANDETIRLSNGAALLRVRFLPTMTVTIKDASGQDVTVTKEFAWATSSDGSIYAIDPEKHALLDKSQAGPSVPTQGLQMFVGTDIVGDPRNPTRATLPKIKTTEGTVEGSVGIQVFEGKTRTEDWNLTYEGVLIPTRTGRFSNVTAGSFADASAEDLELLGAKVGDILLLEDCKPASTPVDGGNPDGNTVGDPCEFTIKEIDKYQLVITIPEGTTIPTKSQWSYQIRAKAGTYLVNGSLSGILDDRVEEGKAYTNNFFGLTIEKGTEPTPRDTRIAFQTISGFELAGATLTGFPARMLSLPSGRACANNCSLDACKEHPSCTNTDCVANSTDAKTQCAADENCINSKCVIQQRIWVLDPAGSQLFVVNPNTLANENTIR